MSTEPHIHIAPGVVFSATVFKPVQVSRITSVQDRDTRHPDSDRPAVAIHGRSICGPTTFATRHRPMRSSHIVTWAERTQTHTNGPGHWNNSGLNSVPATVKVDWH